MSVETELLAVLEELKALDVVVSRLRQRAFELATLMNSKHNVFSPHVQGDTDCYRALFVSPATCTVQWHGRFCILGPGLSILLMHCLSHHPERFYHYDYLLENVWKRHVSDDAVRAIVKQLRHTLKDAGMPDLAAAIRGKKRSYGLFLEDMTT